MDPTAQKPQDVIPTQQPAAAPVQQAQPVAQPTPVQSIPQPQGYTSPIAQQGPPSIHREQEVAPVSKAPVEADVQAVETAPKIDKETAELGVEAVQQHPNLTLEDKKLGVQHAAESVPAFTQANGKADLPISMQQAYSAWKLGKVKEAVTWLAGLLIKNQKKEAIHEHK